ncbi:terminase small subunit [Herbaspirillum chlorophenolicum]|uniref:terminase small subunit n=1 Tax=Herbaspirillum chlorophenolicum TaxID=211589 RepID=UPI00067AAB00|nr:terminase small subunit [Herbaspirillum chlorophenolicum]
MPRNPITPKVERFIDEYLMNLNATQAAIRAGYSVRTAKQIGSDLLSKPAIAEAIARAKAERSARVKVDQDAILRALVAAAHVDRNGLTEYRRVCCRYCHGDGHRYQRTAGEMERDRAEHRRKLAEHKADGKKPNPGRFDPQGGIGYHKLRDPHPDCPECFGEGIGETFIKDTRKLSPEQRAIYEGVEQTRDGMKLKAMDRKAATELLMRHEGMLQDKVDHTTKGDKLPVSAEPAVINVTIGKA